VQRRAFALQGLRTVEITMNNKVCIKKRKTLRLKHYDYSNEGHYFVTICTKNKKNIFGDIKNNLVNLSEIGEIAEKNWKNIQLHFNCIKIDKFVVMPNHIHGILNIDYGTDEVDTVGQRHAFAPNSYANRHSVLSVVIGSYKSTVTKEVNREYAYMKFKWQTSYYEHIIRNEESLRKIREYILLNPARWEFDRENLINKNRKIKEFWEE
jgi:putative transposase